MIKDGIRKRVNETAADTLDVIRKFQFFFVYFLIIWTLWQNAISNQPARLYDAANTNLTRWTTKNLQVSSFDQLFIRLAFIHIRQHRLFRITYVFWVKTCMPSLIPNLSFNISQIYHHYKTMRKIFHMMFNRYSQTYHLETIIEQIYVVKKIKPICSKLIFIRLT